ncbi:MAG: hypothetical protein JST87_09750 [Bacteroidetes bacterium]|nr:hypothetical protein [Bacteroidota bacterium]
MNYKLFMAMMISFTGKIAIAQQGNKEDVIYLKNKWIMRGKILEKDTVLKIQTHDGNMYVFNKDEVDSIKYERTWRNFFYREKGFAHFTELGPLVAGKTTIDGVTTAAFSFQTVNGYKFSQYLFAGLGVGADLYATQTLLPVFASVRGNLLKNGSVIPFYFADAGYAVNITQNSSVANNFKGGFEYALGLGAKIPFNRNAGFLLSIGYRYQHTSYSDNMTGKNVDYKRLAIRAGFSL